MEISTIASPDDNQTMGVDIALVIALSTKLRGTDGSLRKSAHAHLASLILRILNLLSSFLSDSSTNTVTIALSLVPVTAYMYDL